MSSASPPRLVLDTNVVLDCFVFNDAKARELAAAIQSQAVQLLVHDYTLKELRRVLGYPQCRLTEIEQREVLEQYLSVAIAAPMPPGFNECSLLLPSGFPRCRDPHDQPFLALAYHARADGLITKDKAILKLRKKARKFNLDIVPVWHNSSI